MENLTFRQKIRSFFGKTKSFLKTGSWKEFNSYSATFSNFGSDLYANDVVRSSIRALAEHSSKANVKVVRRVGKDKIQGDQGLERVIKFRPNKFMNGKDFIYKVRTKLELYNTAFIYIQKDEDTGRCTGLYPMPNGTVEALEHMGEIYLIFNLQNGTVVTLPWEEVAVLRKDYNDSDIFGDNNGPILGSLDLLETTRQGLGNAIKSTANLRGILKSTKAMLSDDDVKRQKERFVNDYLNFQNEGGIASIDATQEFTPIEMKPAIANYKHTEELRHNIYRYFGVNDDILMSRVAGERWEAFYESRIEPFLIALGLELTNKIFSDRKIGFGNEVIFEASKLQYASTSAKMNMVSLIDRGIITVNEYREILNFAPVDGGDTRLVRKEYAEADNLNEVQGVLEDANNAGQAIQDDDSSTNTK